MIQRTRNRSIEFQVDASDLKRAADALDDAAGSALIRDVSAEFRQSAGDLTGKVRRAVLRIPSWGLYGTALRARLAGNVEGRAGIRHDQAWIRIEVNPYGMPSGLPGAMDSDKKRSVPGHGYVYSFRHPVFGNRSVWANQATYPYFRRTLRNQKRVTDLAIARTLEEHLERVARDSKS